MNTPARKFFAAAGWVVLMTAGSLGCKGDPGLAGQGGQDAKDKGTIAGVITVTGSTSPAVGAQVVANPGNFSTQSGSDGKYAIDVPIGVYTLTFGAGVNNDGFDPVTVANVSVVGGASTPCNASVVQSNPLAVTATGATQTGFGTTVALGVTVRGAPTGTTPSFVWTQISGPPVVITAANSASPTFVTQKIRAVIDARKTYLPVPVRKGQVGISTQYESELSYGFKVTVTAGQFIKSATATVTSASVTSGSHAVPVGVNVVVASPAQSSYAWNITSKPSGSSAAFDFPGEQFATFVPDREGTYTLTETGGSTAWTASVVVASYKGVNFCLLCHDGALQIPGREQVAKWQLSLHKSMFQRGISGAASDHYGTACLSCHTTGDFKGGTISGGFGAVASQLGWQFPATLSPANWTSLPDRLKELGSISCESCHGPGSQHQANPNLISHGMANATCNQCHMAIGHHDRGFLASLGAHSKLALTLEEATIETRGDTAAHCGRCHSAQGYKQYLSQLAAGNNGPLVKPASYTGTLQEWLASIGLTHDKVDGLGCATCHDPHSMKLRIEDSTPVLPAGFAVAGVGAGAVCMTCHNTRNGLHDNAHPLTGYSAPHTPSQTDLLEGQNAYFVSTAYAISKHAAAKDTCATCHVQVPVRGLSILPANYQFGGTNHTFMVNSSICTTCHSAQVTGEALQAEVRQGLADITRSAGRLLLQSYLQPQVNGYQVVAYDAATDRYSAPVVVNVLPADASSISFALEIHGQQSACMTLPAPISVIWTGDTTPSSITNLCFQIGSLKQVSDGTNIVPVNCVLTQALWNYYLVKGDGSLGIHNPTFVNQILANTQAALNPI